MTTADPFEIKFLQSMERARRVAARLLRYPLGAHTCEDVVSIFIEKELKAGKSEEEILVLLNSRGLCRLLANVKNDIFRWETAIKRGRGQPSVSLEGVELFLSTPTDDPESAMIWKEGCAHMNDVLTRLIEKAGLSETQLEILNLDRQGYSSEEVARALGMDVEVVYARRSEAMRKLIAAARHMTGPDL
jgi:DNA-binding CsgD family transcriptional regulator